MERVEPFCGFDACFFCATLDKAERTAMAKSSDEEAAFFYKNTVEPKMATLRKWVDEMEVLTAREAWPMPTYGDLTHKA